MNKEECMKLLKEYKDAVGFCYYEEQKVLEEKLLTALSQEPNQPTGIGEYMLTRKVLVRAFENGELYAVEDIVDDDGKPGTRYLGAVCNITGHWE